MKLVRKYARMQVCKYFESKHFRPKSYLAKTFFKPSVPGGLRIFRAFASLLLLHICWLSVAGSCIEQQASEVNISTGRSGVANKQTRTSPTKQTHPHHTLDKQRVIRMQEGLSCITHSPIDSIAFSLFFFYIFDDFDKYSESEANLIKNITMRRAG